MAHSTRTFRVFVSSTFSDIKAERNALWEKVSPRLRNLASVHGYRFRAIYLSRDEAGNFSSNSQNDVYHV